MIISTLNKCFLVQEKETVPSSLFLSPSLCPEKANQSVLLSALRKLALARSALEGGKAGLASEAEEVATPGHGMWHIFPS